MPKTGINFLLKFQRLKGFRDYMLKSQWQRNCGRFIVLRRKTGIQKIQKVDKKFPDNFNGYRASFVRLTSELRCYAVRD